jgi:hypothetical protein
MSKCPLTLKESPGLISIHPFMADDTGPAVQSPISQAILTNRNIIPHRENHLLSWKGLLTNFTDQFASLKNHLCLKIKNFYRFVQ